VADLTLDPDDGRETGLNLPRHVFPASAATPTNPYAAELDELIRRNYLDYRAKVDAKAAELAEYGLALEEVQVRPDSDYTSAPPTIRMVGTYRIVPLNPDRGDPR
jgi:hypothetical protein